MIDETLKSIDFAHQPDATSITFIAQRLLPWLTGILSSLEDEHLGHEDLPWAVKTAIETQRPAKVQEMHPYERTAGEYYEYAIAFALGLLSRGHLYSDLPIRVLEMVQAAGLTSMQTAASLVLLSLGVKDVEIDAARLCQSIDTGKFFQFPFDVYCRMLDGLNPLAEAPCATYAITTRIYNLFESGSKEYLFGDYKKHRKDETALFLASVGIVTKPVLDSVMYFPDDDWFKGTDRVYHQRRREMVVHLLEMGPEARSAIADYIIAEAKEAAPDTIRAWMQAWQSIEPQHRDTSMLRDLMRVAENIGDAHDARQVVQAIVVLTMGGPLQEEAVRWLIPKLEMAVESGDDLNLFGAYARGSSGLVTSDDRIVKVLKRRARKDQHDYVRRIAREALEGRYA